MTDHHVHTTHVKTRNAWEAECVCGWFVSAPTEAMCQRQAEFHAPAVAVVPA